MSGAICATIRERRYHIAGPAYLAYPYAYTISISCAGLETTSFTATWRDYIGGMKR